MKARFIFLSSLIFTSVVSCLTLNAGEKYPIVVADRVVQCELAMTSKEHEKGLMHRKELGLDEGMLFIFKRPKRQSFWMKNSGIPLDIGFFEQDGTLVEIKKMHPYDERIVYSKSRKVQYALEVNQGWFRNSSVGVGDVLDLRSVDTAVEAREHKAQE